MEPQRGIEDILIKYREAKQAEFAPYIGAGGTLAAAMITGIGTWLVDERQKSRPTPPCRPDRPHDDRAHASP